MRVPAFVVAAILILAALYAGYASHTATDPAKLQTAAGVLAGAAAMVIVLALVRRRRKS